MNQTLFEECIVTEGRSGWLARSAHRGVGIGVTGSTRDEAEENYRLAMDRRVRLLSEEPSPQGDHHGLGVAETTDDVPEDLVESPARTP